MLVLPPQKPIKSISQKNKSSQFIQMTNAPVKIIKSSPLCHASFSSPRHTGCQIKNKPRCTNIKERDRGLPKSSHIDRCKISNIKTRRIVCCRSFIKSVREDIFAKVGQGLAQSELSIKRRSEDAERCYSTYNGLSKRRAKQIKT